MNRVAVWLSTARHRLLAGAALSALVGVLLAPHVAQAHERQEQPTPVAPFDQVAFEDDMAAIINLRRQSAGVRQLKVAPAVKTPAREWAMVSAAAGAIDHRTDLTPYPAAYPTVEWLNIGENLGVVVPYDVYGWRSQTEVEQKFWGSVDHRENVVNPLYTHIAVGAVQSNGRLYMTVAFVNFVGAIPDEYVPQLSSGHDASITVDGTAALLSGIAIHGWTDDPDDPNGLPAIDPLSVTVSVDGQARPNLVSGITRPDLAGRLPAERALERGFQDLFWASPGHHEVCVGVINAVWGKSPPQQCDEVDVAPSYLFRTPPSPGATPRWRWLGTGQTTAGAVSLVTSGDLTPVGSSVVGYWRAVYGVTASGPDWRRVFVDPVAGRADFYADDGQQSGALASVAAQPSAAGWAMEPSLGDAEGDGVADPWVSVAVEDGGAVHIWHFNASGERRLGPVVDPEAQISVTWAQVDGVAGEDPLTVVASPPPDTNADGSAEDADDTVDAAADPVGDGGESEAEGDTPGVGTDGNEAPATVDIYALDASEPFVSFGVPSITTSLGLETVERVSANAADVDGDGSWDLALFHPSQGMTVAYPGGPWRVAAVDPATLGPESVAGPEGSMWIPVNAQVFAALTD